MTSPRGPGGSPALTVPTPHTPGLWDLCLPEGPGHPPNSRRSPQAQGALGGPCHPQRPALEERVLSSPSCLPLPASFRAPTVTTASPPAESETEPQVGQCGPTPPAPRGPGWAPVPCTLRLPPAGPRRGFFPPLFDLRLKTQPCGLRTWDPPRTQSGRPPRARQRGRGFGSDLEQRVTRKHQPKRRSLAKAGAPGLPGVGAVRAGAVCSPGPGPLARVVLPHADHSFPRLPRAWTPRGSPGHLALSTLPTLKAALPETRPVGVPSGSVRGTRPAGYGVCGGY